MLLKMAWRNLWRNKRRTFITLASVAFAVLVAVVMRGFQLGSYDLMIDGTLKSTTGHIQIMHPEYWDDASIDHLFPFSYELEEMVYQDSRVKSLYPRLQSFALAAFGRQSRPVGVVGFDPEREKEITGLHQRLIKGSYLRKNDEGLLLSSDLAEELQLQVGDSLVLFGQGYQGATSVGKLPVRGIFENKYTPIGMSPVYVDLKTAQLLYAAPEMITSVCIMLHNKDFTSQVLSDWQPALAQKEIVGMGWEAMNETLLQGIKTDDISGQIMIGILYLVIGFGIFGTLLMMAAERRREFSVMNAVGMKRHRILWMVGLETFFISALAVIAGLLISVPVNIYFYYHPIEFTGELAEMYAQYNMEPVMRMSVHPGYMLHQAIIVFVLALLAMAGPVQLIRRLKIVSALRGR
jgi:ABC-type lipoprotein release transport system permease subunit